MKELSRTLYEKLWASHLIHQFVDGRSLIYIDRHLVNEVTSPQAFEGLRLAGRSVWRADSIMAAPDHNTPTDGRWDDSADPLARIQVQTLEDNIAPLAGSTYYPFRHARQGILHVVAPELGATLPGTTIVCGDSHTSTHGAFGSLAFGIGTSDVEQVLASQTLVMKKSASMRIHIGGRLNAGVYAKDLMLALIAKMGTAGAAGYVVEYTGRVIEEMSMEARMTLCNMSIEAGARCGLVGVDEVTLKYLEGRALVPHGDLWNRAVKYWRDLRSDPDAKFDRSEFLDASNVAPQVTWGTSPDTAIPVTARIPDPSECAHEDHRAEWLRALNYMGLKAGTPMSEITLDKIFIGSCTNGRIEDLRIAANYLKGRKIASNIKLALVVPGSGQVKRQAEAEGLDKIFRDAGFEWRGPGCSMCLGMNDDRLLPGERCASTSNRNFEGRQGAGGRSHLVSPMTAAAAAVAGHFVDPRELIQ